MASSSSSSYAPKVKYDVFLSFRGDDTRRTITSHLYAALCDKKIQTFIDDDGLNKGEEISPVLLTAIEESMISVIILSESYASSKWCLDELVKILECKRMVIPIFYQVDPSDVRKQTGSIKDAFVKHDRVKEMKEKVQRWRAALTEVGNLSGWDSSKTKFDAELVEKIVEDILMKLEEKSTYADFEGLFGLESRVEVVKSLLCIDLSKPQIIGLWGMGGIGKTTIANALFKQVSNQFEGSFFVANVRERLERESELSVRDQLLSKILKENIKIDTLDIPIHIQNRLQRKKVLIVLDDVDNQNQLEILIGKIDRYGRGSRIIITFRDKQVLNNYIDDGYTYEVEKLNDLEALDMFCHYAFKQITRFEDRMVLIERVAVYAQGNPLALKVLASSLCDKSKQDWESALNRLGRISNPQVHKVLKISYDTLDQENQNILLDVAFFFKGEDRDHVTKILEDYYFSVHYGLSVLIDKSLITVSSDRRLLMHDLIQEMGWEIVRQESPKGPGKRSRLCNHEDVYHVLKNNKGTDSIEGIYLEMSKTRDMQLSSTAFANMSRLRLLIFCNSECHERLALISKVQLPSGLEYLPDELRYLRWDGYPLKSLPPNFIPEHLIALKLPYSNIERLGRETELARKLKIIDLEGSQFLNSIPNLEDAKSLEVVKLSNCKRIRNFPQVSLSISELNLSGTAIKEISSSICRMKSLRWLYLFRCSNIQSFPEILERMECLEGLYLSGASSITEIPSSIENLSGLCVLSLTDLKNLETVSNSICSMTCLNVITLDRCSRLEKLPDNLGNLKKLERLIARETAIAQLPSSVGALCSLSELNLSYSGLTDITQDLCCLTSLTHLDLSGNKFESLPASINQLSQLRYLYLEDCKRLQSIPELPLRLKSLRAPYCEQLKSFTLPRSIEELTEDALEILI